MNMNKIEHTSKVGEQVTGTGVDGRRSELLRALSATFRALMWQGNKHGAATMEEIGLTMPQAIVLGTLGACSGRATMSEIAQLTYQSGATITGIVDRLADAGLVERERDSVDRRVVYVRTTEAGTTKLEEIQTQRRNQMEQMTTTLSNEELEQLNNLISRLIVASE
jgi:MarR family transcriptional regulator, 2-MHQ and catechol-resistance regulon repressor